MDLPLFEQNVYDAEQDDAHVPLPPVAVPLQVVQDYHHLGLSLKAHPLSFLRRSLDRLRVIPCHELLDETRCPHGLRVRVAGLVLVRQRPGTASGITFMTLEDETGIANRIVRPHVFDRYRKAARHSQIIIAHGNIERKGQVVHVMVRAIYEAPAPVGEHRVRARDFH